MPMLQILANGQLVQSDGARSDGKGIGTLPPRVDESSVFLLNPSAAAKRQKLDELHEAKRKNSQLAKKAALRGARKAKAVIDHAKRLETKNKGLSGAIDFGASPRQSALIKQELARQKMAGADFNQYERMADTSDFGHRTMGSRADFEQMQVIGNPLAPDGSYGPVTDYDRFVSGKPYAKEPVSMGSWLSDLTGIDLNVEEVVTENQDSIISGATSYLEQNQASLIQTAGQALGVIPKPPAVQSAPIPKFLPAAVRTAMTGTVALPGGVKIQKAYLYYGAAASLLIGAAIFFSRRRGTGLRPSDALPAKPR